MEHSRREMEVLDTSRRVHIVSSGSLGTFDICVRQPTTCAWNYEVNKFIFFEAEPVDEDIAKGSVDRVFFDNRHLWTCFINVPITWRERAG